MVHSAGQLGPFGGIMVHSANLVHSARMCSRSRSKLKFYLLHSATDQKNGARRNKSWQFFGFACTCTGKPGIRIMPIHIHITDSWPMGAGSF